MKTVAYIPIKLNNERTPGKNIKKMFNGKSIVQILQETLVRLNNLDEIYVFCSDERIKEYLIDGVKFLKRPEFLDTKQATPNDIIDEFMKLVDADVYMVSHATSPFVSVEHFEECINAVKSGEFDSSFTAQKLQKLLWKSNGTPLNFDPENVPRTQDLEPYYDEVSAAYVFTKEMYMKHKRRIGLKPHITVVSELESIDIDYPEDFEIANAVYKEILCK
ncbi:MAG: hypothetical protein PUF84_01570 [Ruminococcus bromii]|nr:hypothetical protein [Ruminococcus bromii]MDD6433291.1 hypothetical protein [Ruminococcus bromii]MDY4711868.1 hypothetical protein [Ruminococcus bromii]